MYLLEPANKDCEHAEASVLTQELSKASDVGLHQLDTGSVLPRPRVKVEWQAVRETGSFVLMLAYSEALS